MTETERPARNWFYALLNVASIAFVVTALAYAIVPVLERKAMEAGQPVPPSPLRNALRENGWWWLLIQAGAVGVLALCSMSLDRWRQRESSPTQAENTAEREGDHAIPNHPP